MIIRVLVVFRVSDLRVSACFSAMATYASICHVGLPSLEGGAGDGDLITKAIRSGWRHGVDLEAGRKNPGVGNCSFEVCATFVLTFVYAVSFRPSSSIFKIELVSHQVKR